MDRYISQTLLQWQQKYVHVLGNGCLCIRNASGRSTKKLLRESHPNQSTSSLQTFGVRPVTAFITIATLMFATTACIPSSGNTVEIATRAPAPTFTATTAVQPAAEQPAAEQPAAEQPAVEVVEPEPAKDVVEVAEVVEAVEVVEPTEQPAEEEVAVPVEEIAEEAPVEEAEPATATPVPPAAQITVNTQLLNVRGGPGTNYATVGIINQGERFDITGKNNTGDWWEIDYNNQRGWVFDTLVTTSDTQGVTIAALIPAPPPPTAAPVVVAPPTPVPYVPPTALPYIPPTAVPYRPPPATATLTAAQAAYYAAIAAGQNPNPQPVAPQPQPQPQPPTAAPPPTAVPAQPTVAPPPTEPPKPAEPSFPFLLLEGVETCEPNAGQTYFKGFVRYKSNEPRNAVCVHIGFYGPRTTKCSGCDGVGAGNWGFSPFGGPAPAGTTVEIFVVSCPSDLPAGGQNGNFSDLTPRSKKWVRTINESEQCAGITFVGDE